MAKLKPSEEWVVFRDPKDPAWRWRFDVRFLTSGYHCVFGCGCPGVEGNADLGACCAYGVQLLRDEFGDDVAKVKRSVKRLEPGEWDNAERAAKRGWKKKQFGGPHTRTARGACIFHNHGDNGLYGCALHGAALRRGEDPYDWKPHTCSIVPLMTETDDDERLYTVGPVQNADWGEGEEALDWWCIDDPVAYTASEPLYRTMSGELRRILPGKVYKALVAYLDDYMTRHEITRRPVNFIGVDVEPTGVTGIPLPMHED